MQWEGQCQGEAGREQGEMMWSCVRGCRTRHPHKAGRGQDPAATRHREFMGKCDVRRDVPGKPIAPLAIDCCALSAHEMVQDGRASVWSLLFQKTGSPSTHVILGHAVRVRKSAFLIGWAQASIQREGSLRSLRGLRQEMLLRFRLHGLTINAFSYSAHHTDSRHGHLSHTGREQERCEVCDWS